MPFNPPGPSKDVNRLVFETANHAYQFPQRKILMDLVLIVSLPEIFGLLK